MLERLRYNIKVIKKQDPAAKSSIQVLLCYPGLHAVMLHRPAHWLYRHNRYFLARLLSHISRFFTQIEIHPGAEIGWGLFIDHGCGVVIGETAVIGNNCIIYQGVTLGGTGKEIGKRHPTLGDHVMVGCGAKILGPFKVGSCSRIASGAVVLQEVPEHSTAVGVPAKIVKIKGEKLSYPPKDLDQVHIPNPVQAQINELALELNEIKKELAKLKKKK
ncbi:MAG: serine O-acetyltransferase [Oscillospiraceae bacterium]|nr:serine O-acetyltransferase [Oscillospiraceae bacterium]